MTDRRRSEVVEALVREVPILAVARELTQLKRVGREWRGGCPICHASFESQAFKVDDGRAGRPPGYKCFRCWDNGDVINLQALAMDKPPHVKGIEFWEVVHALANRFGVQLPRFAGEKAGHPEAPIRSRTQDMWNAAHHWLGEALRRASRGGESESTVNARHDTGVGGRSSPDANHSPALGLLTPELDGHLATLGYESGARIRAALDTESLKRVPLGVVLLRTRGRLPAGLSAQAPDGQWVHLTAPDETGSGRLDLAMLSPPPKARRDQTSYVVATELTLGLTLGTILRRARTESGEEGERRLASRLAVIAWASDDPADLEQLSQRTERALIVIGPAGATRPIARTARAVLEHGFDARATSIGDSAHARSALSAVVEAPHVLDWQWEVLRDVGATEGSTLAQRWMADEVQPIIRRVSDRVHAAILTERAEKLSGVAATDGRRI